mgnify:CR=1 FL=1
MYDSVESIVEGFKLWLSEHPDFINPNLPITEFIRHSLKILDEWDYLDGPIVDELKATTKKLEMPRNNKFRKETINDLAFYG